MSIVRNLREGYVLMFKPEKLEKSLGMDIIWYHGTTYLGTSAVGDSTGAL